MISRLRHGLGLSQTAFGHEVHSSAMGVSRRERGAQERPSHSYIEIGNLAGDPDCWFFGGRAGLRSEDLMRVMPNRGGFQAVHCRHAEIEAYQVRFYFPDALDRIQAVCRF
jgi:hypothetical protein